MFGRRSLGLYLPGAVCALFVGCGGPEEDPDPDGCGPNGSLHQSFTGNLHCHCDSGFDEFDGICLPESETDTPPSPPISNPPPPPPSEVDCGANASFDGSRCRCDEGFTLVGDAQNLSCAAIPACTGQNDPFEPNDSPGLGTSLSQVQDALYACPADEDWYVFSVSAGDQVTAQIQFDGSSVDLDLFLFEPQATNPTAFSVEAAGDAESASFVSRASGTAVMLVVPYGVGEGGYLMQVNVEPGQAPVCANPGAFCQRSSDCCSGSCHVGHCH
ncbi:MAG: pre-peptidase C-terminal domain-containing protein [Myxococcota bacterium]